MTKITKVEIMLNFLKSLLCCVLFFLPLFTLHCHNPEKEFAVLYNGRFRPSEAYARLWLSDLYHKQSLKKSDLPLFDTNDPSALELLLNLQVFGYTPWKSAPLFWVKSAELKKLASLELQRERFSYQELSHAFYEDPHSSSAIVHYLAVYEFLQAYLNPLNYAHSDRFELKNLAPGLWVNLNHSDLVIASVPEKSRWAFLITGQVLAENVRENAAKLLKQKKQISENLLYLMSAISKFEQLTGQTLPLEEALESRFSALLQLNLPPKRIADILEKEYPLLKRLNAAGSLFDALPSRYREDWFSLQALKVKMYSPYEKRLVPVTNFTRFDNDQFEKIRQAYLEWEKSALRQQDKSVKNNLFYDFSVAITEAYRDIAGNPYKIAAGKSLLYPSMLQLQMESIYYQYPWTEILLLLYSISAILLFCAYRINNSVLIKLSFASLLLAFILHTILLTWRSYLLNRPPVSNMFETVIYVPWVAVLCGLLLNLIRSHLLVLISASIASITLLIVLKLTDLNSSFDNVQAVLDSQFWLMIHVLMIVGSYGIFILGAVISHFYLILYLSHRTESPSMHFLSQFILQTMYLGLVLLIPGTLLGGVWAAESWGRFWDWDPKESWAFISICLYLVWVHAYRYHRIRSFGLAVGSISGLLAISFTWYGVNYILGTGLHSYGFGSGGEIYYYGFVGIEVAFVVLMLCVHKNRTKIIPT